MSEKQIYIATEQVYSGSVTVGVMTSGVEAESFEDAKNILKANLNEHGLEVLTETDKEIHWSGLGCSGMMKADPLTMLTTP